MVDVFAPIYLVTLGGLFIMISNPFLQAFRSRCRMCGWREIVSDIAPIRERRRRALSQYLRRHDISLKSRVVATCMKIHGEMDVESHRQWLNRSYTRDESLRGGETMNHGLVRVGKSRMQHFSSAIVSMTWTAWFSETPNMRSLIEQSEESNAVR